MVAGLEVVHLRPDFLDDAGEFMAEGLADARVGHHAVIKVQVRPADTASRDAYDRVAGVLDFGHRLFVDADSIWSAIVHGAHSAILWLEGVTCGERPWVDEVAVSLIFISQLAGAVSRAPAAGAPRRRAVRNSRFSNGT
jgi:hypothetical protein